VKKERKNKILTLNHDTFDFAAKSGGKG